MTFNFYKLNSWGQNKALLTYGVWGSCFCFKDEISYSILSVIHLSCLIFLLVQPGPWVVLFMLLLLLVVRKGGCRHLLWGLSSPPLVTPVKSLVMKELGFRAKLLCYWVGYSSDSKPKMYYQIHFFLVSFYCLEKHYLSLLLWQPLMIEMFVLVKLSSHTNFTCIKFNLLLTEDK